MSDTNDATTGAAHAAALANLTPGSEDWRFHVAMYAYQFFNFAPDPQPAAVTTESIPPTAAAAPKSLPFDPRSVVDFSHYLGELGLPGANNAILLTKLLGSLERAGLLWLVGRDPRLPVMAERYYSAGRISKGQRGGGLWLSPVFGAGLIIPSYNAVTIQLAGHDHEGNPVDSWGTGIIVDHNHVITNKHVVAGTTDFSVSPSRTPPDAEQVEAPGKISMHPTIDIAVIEVDVSDGRRLPQLAGMAFRDPEWADEVYVFGYPRVPMTAEMAITVQRGEVVNPVVEAIPDRQKMFLYSAIARPGNSGGPIVAQDGRIIGLVVEDSAASNRAGAANEQPPPTSTTERLQHLDDDLAELKAKVFAPSFYRGIPSSEVVRALDDLGFGGLIEMDDLS